VIRELQEAIDFTVDLVDAMKRLLEGDENDGDVRLIEEAEAFLDDVQN
jgi:hemerythrin-like domain-containing protein